MTIAAGCERSLVCFAIDCCFSVVVVVVCCKKIVHPSPYNGKDSWGSASFSSTCNHEQHTGFTFEERILCLWALVIRMNDANIRLLGGQPTLVAQFNWWCHLLHARPTPDGARSHPVPCNRQLFYHHSYTIATTTIITLAIMMTI